LYWFFRKNIYPNISEWQALINTIYTLWDYLSTNNSFNLFSVNISKMQESFSSKIRLYSFASL
jgi:hypothetical protein